MSTTTASQAQAKLCQLMEETAASHEPIVITGPKNNAVLISEDDWKAIVETIYLNSIPKMAESIRNGMDEAIEDCSEELDW